MVSPLKSFFIQILILVASCQLPAVSCFADYPEFIRVAIAQDVDSVSIRINGDYEVISSDKKDILYYGKNLDTVVSLYAQGILIGSRAFNTQKLWVKAKTAEIIIDGRKFKDSIWFIKRDNLRLWVINEVRLEDYVKGILYHEVSHYWPQEALKAQAVACRSYAVYQIQNNISQDFDVTCDIYSQVYGGKTSERYRTNLAVDATKGQILTYKGKIFPTYYHATCAGYTEDASLVWNIDIAPLKGVLCSYCRDSPHFKWYLVLSLKDLEYKLRTRGYNLKEIKQITIVERSKSGRILKLKVSTESKDIEISGKDFRNIIGPNLIRSTNFKLEIVNGDAVFIGYGWGHGVGMCQWGAYFMAKKGYSYKDILSYYYPGSDISLIDNQE
ncbi:MAG: SpoIID/LytB domain-containing protein [Candidatus Omnitrophica bacterium]|nr:SpoIID/LytB domain-containing protein [Candidatus Omnitrophota bacterium]